ncbi:cilia- and flagella-associated protein 119 isoform X2 [Hydra vulgaris]|uniref:cilia- and flagella-associated protein 119 isoform X2 n=1 Tax=Hydra vulgaris TaxID=6087 RepID=UPI0032E9FE8F
MCSAQETAQLITQSNICVWADLSYEEMCKINLFEWPEDVKNFLCHKFGFQFESLSLKDSAIVDLFYYTLLFAKNNNFNEEQTSALFSIIKRVHTKATETSFGNLEETIEYFRFLLGCHSAKRPPFCIQLYNLNEISLINTYIVKTYFRHFKLYKYAFTPKVVLNIKASYNGVYEDTPKDEETLQYNANENKAEICVEKKETEEIVEVDEPPAVKELKQLIESSLDEHIRKLTLNVEEKLKTNEALMTQLTKESTKSLTTKSIKIGKK